MKPFGNGELIKVLKGVSRSFVLTIRALPRPLRRPVGLAYLLARASDTIADTASAPVETRAGCLRAFVGRLDGGSNEFFGQLNEIKPENRAEQYLLANLERVIAAVEALPEADRTEIVALLQKITRGQELDLLRFPDAGEIRALETAAELNEYTYLVAGCVGEFWTRICSAHMPRYGRLGSDELCELGRGFGQGLQLVNILRDLPEDIAKGRCYLPMAELRSVGVPTPEDLSRDLRATEYVFAAWRQEALRHLEEGRRYIEAIRPWRIRFACLIPWALGVRTLKLMGEKSPLDQPDRVKVGRKEVRQIIRRAAWAAFSNGVVRKWGLEG
jgi:farnesyl-diphosphate farnesyltransferase